MRKLSNKQSILAKEQVDKINEISLQYENKLNLETKELLNRIYFEMLALKKKGQFLSQFEIKKNYLPEFIALLRKHYNKVFERFYNFNRKLILNGFDVNTISKSTSIFSDAIDNEIDKELDYNITLFINNESEKRANFIAETTAEKIYKNFLKSSIEFENNIKKKENEITKNNIKASTLFIFGSEALRNTIAKKNENIAKEIKRLRENSTQFIDNLYTEFTTQDATNRADLIGSTEVGMVVSKVLNEERQIIDNYKDVPLESGKYKGLLLGNIMEAPAWFHTNMSAEPRISHIAMSGEIKDGEYYSNGLRYPGDPDGSLNETVHCKCKEIIVPRDEFI